MLARHALALTACLLSGCSASIAMFQGPAVKGSGVMREESREVAAFSQVTLRSALHAEIQAGSPVAVKVRADDNIVPLVVTEVIDGTLVVRLKDNTSIQNAEPIRVLITTPALEALDVEGACQARVDGTGLSLRQLECEGAAHAEIEGLLAETLELEASGAAQVKLAGKAVSVVAELSGASQLEAKALEVASYQIDLDGASRAQIRATTALKAVLSGAGALAVEGQPAQRAVKTSGAASVTYGK